MKTNRLNAFALVAVAVAVVLVVTHNFDFHRSHELLNVSYAPTAGLYDAIDRQFGDAYAKQTGERLVIKQSHGGSSRQSKAVINGLDADVVTLALPSDVEALHKRGLLPDGWAQRLPNNSQPYTSTIVFVVRKGNPKNIHDWPDLIASDVLVITPSPKTSGNGKLSFLAAWGSIVARGGTEDEARDYIQRLYQHTGVLGASATDAASTFAYDQIGDVHLTWESEALQEVAASGGELEIVYPPVSIEAEPTVAWIDANVARHHTEAEAKAYLRYLFSDEGQETLAEQGYRPINPAILAKHTDRLPPIQLFPVTAVAKDWDDAQSKFFADNAIFDVIYKPKAN